MIKKKITHQQGPIGRAFTKTKPFIAGLWKFNDTVPLEKLIILAEHWTKTNSGYFQIFIRQVGSSENGIAFIYQPKILPAIKDYQKQTSQELKEKFGNNLTGWDVAISLWIAK
jgi:hypothetical protein